MSRGAVTIAALSAVVRAYQHANTREEMAAADAMAEALLGKAPLDTVPPKPRAKRGKVARS